MNHRGMLRLISMATALLSIAIFGFYVYSGLTLTPTQCGTVPCTSNMLTVVSNRLNALSDYIYGISALLAGQVALALLWFLGRSPQPRDTRQDRRQGQ